MTIGELEKKLKEIDQTLFIDKSFDEPILSIKTVDENLIIYDFERKLFFRDGLQVFWDRDCNDTDNYFCALQRLVADYQGEMKAQTISKDSKNENSSTAAFSKPASKDSQKKPLRIVDKDQFKRYQVKLFNERFCYYEFHKDLDDAINDFCLKHNVIKIEFFQDEKKRLNAVVTYVIYKIESDPLIDECN